MDASSLRSVSMSRTCGMFSSVTSSSVRMAAAMQGSAEFFAPDTRMVPTSGLPPRMTNLSMELTLPLKHQFNWLVAQVPQGIRTVPGRGSRAGGADVELRQSSDPNRIVTKIDTSGENSFPHPVSKRLHHLLSHPKSPGDC